MYTIARLYVSKFSINCGHGEVYTLTYRFTSPQKILFRVYAMFICRGTVHTMFETTYIVAYDISSDLKFIEVLVSVLSI